MKKNKISKNWVNKQRRDTFVRQSKIDGYRARSAYKLIEIDEKFKIFRGGMHVVDLGAAPGSWSQYVLKNVKNGKIVSIDFKDFEKIGNIHQIIGDFTDDRYKKEIVDYFGVKVDVVLSDLAVNTTGNKNLDSIYTGELCMEAMKFSKETLKSDGKFISKMFMGSTFNEIVSEAKKIFKENKVFKPLASKKDSKESFIICKYLR